MLTDPVVRAIQASEVRSEKLGGRGSGVLLLRGRTSSTEAYYRYRHGGKETSIKLGEYKKGNSTHGYTLGELRKKAQDLARLRQEIAPLDLKVHLETQAAAELQAQQERLRQHEIEEARGSFGDLLAAYVSHLERKKKTSTKQVAGIFKRYVRDPFPELVARKARDITPNDVVVILGRMIDLGIETTTNRTRSYLHAAFAYGLRSDHDPRHRVGRGKLFHLEFNPVQAVPRQADFERSGERALTPAELYDFWWGVEKVATNRVTVLALRLMLALGGVRASQLLSCVWSDVDLERRTIRIVDDKGRGLPRPYLLPLTDRAQAMFEELRRYNSSYEWPFTTRGRERLRGETLWDAIRAYREQQAKIAEEQGLPAPESFSLIDLRRTAKGVLIDAKVGRNTRNLIQNHGQTDVAARHYEKTDFLREKYEGLKIYDALLTKIIAGEYRHEFRYLADITD